jgi:hypothetical protein
MLSQLDVTATWMIRPFAIASCWCLLAGCGGGAELPKGTVKKAPVSGTVTLKGTPLADAEVYFYTEKFTGFGKTDEDGKFSLAQGAAVGTNKVYISKLEGGAVAASTTDPTLALDDPTQTEIASQSQAANKRQPKQLVPPEFSSQATTKLTFDVPDGGEKAADFNL